MLNSKQQRLRATALVSYFSLITFLLLWITWLAPSRHFPTAMVLVVLVVPLLFPLRGILHGRAYTHAWTGFLALLYLIHGISDLFANPSERIYGAIEIVLSLALFFSCAFYARTAGGRERGGQSEGE